MAVRKKKTTTKTMKSEYGDTEAYTAGYDDDSRSVFLVGDVTEEVIKAVTEKIIHLSEKRPKRPINLIINTYGGDVDDTFMLYDMMKYIPTPIHTVGLGKIMSAGCLLLAAGEKGERKIGKNARVMYHLGWDHTVGTIFELRASLDAFEKQEQQYDAAFAEETGLSIKEVEKLYNKNGPTADKYISAQEALDLGVVDEIIE